MYRALSADSTFSFLANVPEGEHDDSIIAANTGYLYYVKALYNGALESVPSNTVFVQTGSLNDTTGDDSSGVIHFTSQPVLSGMVGEPYQYQAAVVTTPPGLTVCYELTHAPSGMSVDAERACHVAPRAPSACSRSNSRRGSARTAKTPSRNSG